MGELVWVGHYTGGRPSGVCWTSIRGGAWLVGRQTLAGDNSGPEFAYIYPDMKTALVGEWKHGVMVTARPAVISGSYIEEGIMVPTYTYIGEREYHNWVSTNVSMPGPQHLRDPLEMDTVRVECSGVGLGDGLYAARDLCAGELVAFYNGIRLGADERSPYFNSDYAIMVEWENKTLPFPFPWVKTGQHLDLPPEYCSTDNYTSTLAHKINHSFRPNCRWANIEHPCYGLVPCVHTHRDVSKGEELTIHYQLDMEAAPEWYLECWPEQSIGENGEKQSTGHIDEDQTAGENDIEESTRKAEEKYSSWETEKILDSRETGKDCSLEETINDQSLSKTRKEHSPEETRNEDSYEKTEIEDSHEEIGNKDGHEETGKDDSHEKNGNEDSREETGNDDSYEKIGNDDIHKETGNYDSYEKTQYDDTHEETENIDRHEKTGNEDGHEETENEHSHKDTEKEHSYEETGNKHSHEHRSSEYIEDHPSEKSIKGQTSEDDREEQSTGETGDEQKSGKIVQKQSYGEFSEKQNIKGNGLIGETEKYMEEQRRRENGERGLAG